MTFYFSTLFIILVMVFMVTAIGLRICDLFPYRLRPISRYYFSPLLGLAALTLLLCLYGWLAPFKTTTSLGLVIILVAVSLFFERNKQTLPRYFFGIFAFAALAATPVLAPILRFGAYNPFNDTFTYLVHGQWLQTHSFSEPAVASGYFPALSQVVQYQSAGHRMGASFMLAWAQAAFGLRWSYYAYPAVVSLPLIVGSLAVGGAVKLIIRRQRIIAMLSACATALMLNGFAFGAIYGFLPQTFGLAFATGGITLLGGLLTESLRQFDLKKIFLHSIPVALVFAALTFSYNDILPFVVVAIIGCLFFFLFLQRGTDKKKRILLPALVLLIETIILVNFEFVRIVRNFIDTLIGVASGTYAVGWPVLWKPYEFLAHSFGFRSPIANFWIFYKQSLSLPLFIAVLVLIFYFLYLFRKKRRSIYLYLNIGIILAFIIGFLYFRYLGIAPTAAETGDTFLQFKLAKWASPFCFILLGTTCAYFSSRNQTADRILRGFLILLIISGFAANLKFSEYITNNFLDETGYRHSAFSSLLYLRETVKDINPDQIIYLNLGAEDQKLRQMVAYVLSDRKLASNYSDDGYIYGKLPPNERDIPFSSATWIIEKALPSDFQCLRSPIVGNLVIKKRPQVLTNLTSVTGGYARETDGNNWWNWTANTLSYKYHVLGALKTVRLKFAYMPATDGRVVNISINSGHETNMTLKMAGGWQNYISQPINVDGPDISITFKSNNTPVKISNHDPRLMSYLIKNMELVIPSEHDSGAECPARSSSSTNRETSSLASLLSVKGGYNKETEGIDWWYWTDKQLIFDYEIPIKTRRIRLNFSYMPATERRTVKIILTSRQKTHLLLKMKGGWHNFTSQPLNISGSHLSIKFISGENPVRISDKDKRLLSFLIKNMEIKDAQQ
ncbi:MAG: hypothetical protein ACYC9J_02690 [Sulfuricaulis sp.]